MRTRIIGIGFVAMSAALAAASCSHNPPPQHVSPAELSEYQTTCLKRGLPEGTDEHAQCVVNLYATSRKRQVLVQQAVDAINVEAANTQASKSD